LLRWNSAAGVAYHVIQSVVPSSIYADCSLTSIHACLSNCAAELVLLGFIVRHDSTLVSNTAFCTFPPLSCKQGVWGCARPRQLHGLLGPSGAGKSTLLDLLTMRLHNENCTGQLHINGAPITQQQLANSSVYVPQVRCRDAHMSSAADNWQLRTAAVGDSPCHRYCCAPASITSQQPVLALFMMLFCFT
jgi:hypothetical protein